MVHNPFEQLSTDLQEIKSIVLQLAEAANQKSQPENRICSRSEAAKFLGITLPTLHKLTQQGKVKGHRIGSQIRYYQRDLEKGLTEIKPFRKVK